MEDTLRDRTKSTNTDSNGFYNTGHLGRGAMFKIRGKEAHGKVDSAET